VDWYREMRMEPCISRPSGPGIVALGIPVKLNRIPDGNRTAFRSEGEQQSERSDAGVMIVPDGFGFVN
jgi:hypothetical protein